MEEVWNETDEPWTEYMLSLGTGFGNDFELADPDEGLYFDFESLFNDAFDQVSTNDSADCELALMITAACQPTEITFSDGMVLEGESCPNGEPDCKFAIAFNVVVPGNLDFTLRQMPGIDRVSEPAILSLFGAGLLGLGISRGWARRRRRRLEDT